MASNPDGKIPPSAKGSCTEHQETKIPEAALGHLKIPYADGEMEKENSGKSPLPKSATDHANSSSDDPGQIESVLEYENDLQKGRCTDLAIEKGAKSKLGLDYTVDLTFLSNIEEKKRILTVSASECAKYGHVCKKSQQFLRRIEKSHAKVEAEYAEKDCRLKIQFTCLLKLEEKTLFQKWVQNCLDIINEYFDDTVSVTVEVQKENLKEVKELIKSDDTVKRKEIHVTDAKNTSGCCLLGHGEAVFDIIDKLFQKFEQMPLIDPETNQKLCIAVVSMGKNFLRIAKVFQAIKFELPMDKIPNIKAYYKEEEVKLIGNAIDMKDAMKATKSMQWLQTLAKKDVQFKEEVMSFLLRPGVEAYIDEAIAKEGLGSWLVLIPEKGGKKIVRLYSLTEDSLAQLQGCLKSSFHKREILISKPGKFATSLSSWRSTAKQLEKDTGGKFMMTEHQKTDSTLELSLRFTADLSSNKNVQDFIEEIRAEVLKEAEEESVEDSETDEIELDPMLYRYICKYKSKQVEEVANSQKLDLQFQDAGKKIVVKGSNCGINFLKQYTKNVPWSRKCIILPESIVKLATEPFCGRYECLAEIRSFPYNSKIQCFGGGFVMMVCCFETIEDLHVDVMLNVSAVSQGWDFQGFNHAQFEGSHIRVDVQIPEYCEEGKEQHKVHEVFQAIFTKMVQTKKRSLHIPMQKTGNWPVRKFVECVLFSLGKLSQENSTFQVIFSDKDQRRCDKMIYALNESVTKTSQREKLVELNVERGEIAKANADVIVNTTSTDFNLSLGAVSSSIMKEARGNIQLDLKGKKAKHGEILVTDSYHLKCKKVFHGALKSWTADPEEEKECLKVLRQFVLNCLDKATELRYTSIAFPAIGTGQIGIPSDEVVNHVRDAIKTFMEENPQSSLKIITFIIYYTDEETFKTFEKLKGGLNKGTVTDKRDQGAAKNLVLWGEAEMIEKAAKDLENSFIEEVKKKCSMMMDVKDFPKEPTAPEILVRGGPAQSLGKDFSVTVKFAAKAIREPCQESFSADFLELRKWRFIFTSKKMKQNFLHSGFQASVSHFGSGQLDVDVFSSSEMSESQFLDWKTSFYEEVEKLDVISIELQGSEIEISVLNKELDGIENIADILDVLKFDNQPSFIYIQGLPEDIIFILSSKCHQIHSMDMIDPYTSVKQGYFTLEMTEPAWNFIETFDSIEKARKKHKTVHFCKTDKKVCGIGDAEAVEEVKKFFCDGLYMKGILHRIIKDFPVHVLEFMKRKSLRMTIDHKVKKHGMWMIGKDNGLHVYGKTEDELKVIGGVIRRFILWNKIPLQRNALPFLGEKLEKMLASCKEQKVLDTEKISVIIDGVAHSEHPTVLLIYTADVAEQPSFIDFLKELEENVQYEKKTIELSYHSYLKKFHMNDIQEVAKNQYATVDFLISGKINIEGLMVGVGFVEKYLQTFASYHSIIPVPNLEAIVQKVHDLKERICPSIEIFKDEKAKMWLTQTISVIVYCSQRSDALDRHVSVIPEVTENKELSRIQENIQWEEVNQSSVHLRCPKWQSGDLKDKHLMRDTIEEMMNQMRTYAKTSVLFCLHDFPTWPVDKLAKSIISSTRNLKDHLKIILIDPDEENCKKVNETLRVSLNDSDEKAVYFVDVWGAENVRKAVSAELDLTFSKETEKIRPSEKVKQTKLREPPEQTMSFRDASAMEKPNQKRTPSDDSEQNEEKGCPAGNEEERSCLVVTFVSRQVDTKNIAKITKSVNPRAVIHPYEKENMALIVFENATDAAKVIEKYKKNPEIEILLDFLPNQAVVGIRAQISSMFLEKFKDRIGLQKGVESSSGVRVEEIPGRKWLLTGSLPQIHLAHNYLRNELTKIKSATEHSIQSQGTGNTPPQSTTVQAADHADTSDISKSRRSQRSFNAESPSTGGSAFMSQKSNVQELQIPMEEILYEILLFFHSYWSGKECCRQITYENGNLKLIGNKENIEKLESELPALLAEINRDQLKSQDLVFKDLLRNVEKREQLDVFVKYFENVDSCWLEFAGFSNEKINELKDNLMREIEKEKKAIESRKLSVAEGGTSANEEPKNVQTFYTNESLEIKVYKGSITNLNVDCIVSSNTRKLENFMGVAKAIANAAGPGFTAECKNLVKSKGEIEKGFCCTTGPGKLPYKYVIHVVGPIWTAKSNSDVGSILKQSILSILKEATEIGVRSVAIPAISAGQNHANKKLCTRIYAEAVCLFSSEQPKLKSTLKEIHFIDREDGMVELIGKGFKEHFESNAVQRKASVQPVSTGDPPVMRTVFKPSCEVRMMKGSQAEEYNLTEFFKVTIWLGNILEFPKKYAVCCGQDSDFKSNSNIAKQFKSQQDVKNQIADIKKSRKSFRTGDVFQVKGEECMIYYVIIKSFTENTKKVEEFLSNLTLCVKKVLCKAEESKERAIAVPLLGTGNKGAQKSKATNAWFEGVLQFLRETFSKPSHHLREVYFVSSSQEDVATMASLFKQRIDTCKSVQSVVFESFL